MSDEELMRFCAANDALRVERDANGEILVMTPAGSKTSKMNMRIGRLLDEWPIRMGVVWLLTRMADSRFLTAPCAPRMLRRLRCPDGRRLAMRISPGTLLFARIL